MRIRCSFTIRILSVVLLGMALGCDRSSQDNSGVDSSADHETAPARLAVELTPIAPLLPRLNTHVAVDGHGNVYWVQESVPAPDGGDLVFVMGLSGVPQTVLNLSVPRLLEALGSEESRRGNGAIRSIAIGPDDDLYVLFTGGRDRAPIWALARYSPRTGKINIVADTQRLMSESHMGASIDLARGSLVGNGHDLWLWLRHSDATSLLQVIPIKGGAEAELRRQVLKPPTRVMTGQLNSEAEDLAAGPEKTLYYVDRPRAMIWKIDAFGEFIAFQSLEGFSRGLTTPAIDDTGRVCIIAGQGSPLGSKDFIASGALAPLGKPAPAWAQMAYPVLMQIRINQSGQSVLSMIKSDDFFAPAALPVQDLEPHGLLFDSTTDTLIFFDDASGELLRLKVTKR